MSSQQTRHDSGATAPEQLHQREACKWVAEAMYFAETATATSNHKDYLDLLRAHLQRQADLMERMGEALELLVNDQGPDYIKSSSWDKARAALLSHKGER
jgi:hypothetical protein